MQNNVFARRFMLICDKNTYLHGDYMQYLIIVLNIQSFVETEIHDFNNKTTYLHGDYVQKNIFARRFMLIFDKTTYSHGNRVQKYINSLILDTKNSQIKN